MGELNPLRRLRSTARSEGRPEGRAATPADGPGADLIAAGRGDEQAFGRFYDQTSSLVHGVVLRVVRDPAMAEEVTQEVFVELWRLAPRYSAERGSATAWASTIAHRRAVDRVRSEQRRRDREDRDARTPGTGADPVAESVADHLDRVRVRNALDLLSPAQRECIELAYYRGYTYREVAAVLGIAEGTAKTRLRDALIKLRDSFGVGS